MLRWLTKIEGLHMRPENCHTKLDLVSMVALSGASQHAGVDSSVKHWNDTGCGVRAAWQGVGDVGVT